MAPVALQMRLAASRTSVKSVQKVFGPSKPQRMPVQQRNARHVALRSTKLEEVENSSKADKKSKKEEEDEFDGDEGLTPQQVEDLLTVLCEETDIAEVELKMGGFKMKVRRSLKGGAAATAAPAAATAPAPAPAPVAAAAPSFDAESSYDDGDDVDGSVIAITAPKVGTLRRGRFIKGKQIGKANVVEIGDTVKKGQVIAYIEQLGTHWPVECPQAGEIVSFVVDDGEAVEYLQPVVEISPFFGGHIIGDSKYA
ncbi:putative Biotin carboxyl carrier protein of acetyl-CoA carboxylase [Nannochloris sp. 'desiccata']|nr:putative Biotin carboxyl carrier protein of acetyl-CoA carboxylase [Chlorella desiccata (nom. nud.)]